MILQQLGFGSAVVKKLVKDDITKFSDPETAQLDSSPIVNMIKDYNTSSRYFKIASGSLQKIPPLPETSAPDNDSRAYYEPVWSAIWKNAASNGKNPITNPFFKTFIYAIFRNYVLQYNIGGASDNETKINVFYPYWYKYIGNIKIFSDNQYVALGTKKAPQSSSGTTTFANGATIARIFNITQATLRAYTMDISEVPEVPPSTTPGVKV